MKIDVIVPIYNAYDYTVKCVESVLNNTDSTKYNLILVNDKSTDNRIDVYLENLKSSNIDNLYILNNDSNLGFVKTVNRGMSFSNNDIVLLNSDTEVTKDWLMKMSRAAYLNENVATVTPLTNNGTICSVPEFCKDNELPKDLTLDNYAYIVEKTSLKLYPDIPTAVGFCMYIKRKVINEIGMFDSETFGKGYGEENDFCCRAIENGYSHILCDDTFVYHKGSTSFLGEKEELCKKNLKILNQRYKYYDRMINDFVKSDVLKPISDNINLQLKIRNNNKNVLFILHNDFLKGINHPVGGTEYHVKDLIENIDGINFFVMYVSDNKINLQLFNNNSKQIGFNIPIKSLITNFTFGSTNYKINVEKIIEYFDIDCIHIHHFKTNTFDIIDIAKEREIPIYLTIHDFYLICPTINLLDEENTYCENIRGKEKCNNCLKSKLGCYTNVLPVWNRKVYDNLKRFDKVFTPSESCKKIIDNYYKEIYEDYKIDIEVVEHGLGEKYLSSERKNKNDNFKVAFIGGISVHKGSGIIYDLVKKNNDKNIEWHIFGDIGDSKLDVLLDKHIIKHGRYDRNNIEKLLNEYQIDLVCILSIWPETYSYTLSETILAGIPALVTDIGALGERVKKYECGWCISRNLNYKEILNSIYSIKSDIDSYNEKIENIRNIKLLSKQEIASKYKQYYLDSRKNYFKSNLYYNREMFDLYLISNDEYEIENIESMSRAIQFIKNENNNLKQEILTMKNTLGWKILNCIRIKFPFLKKVTRKFLYFIKTFKS
ncbi:glycosyltransferase [Clostridioides sp. ZZV14-6345]|uniref:glycosyltransferase n=1 Tax=Clostridioides sp. ZZV14-6345 TaxID=2811496 RepID=UPI001D11A405|nr:glycosyltransferase [Clostridioides sp. ZZV14-6345]